MVIDRILKIIELKKMSKSAFYKATGISNGFLDKVKEVGASKLEDILNAFPDINAEWLLLGIGPIYRSKEVSNSLNEPSIQYGKEKGVPLFELTANAGILNVFSESKANVPIDYITIPGMPRCDGAIHITGDSMYPLLKSGDMVLYKHLNDKRNIVFGEMYIMYINDHGDEFFFVKYVQPSDQEGYVRLVSENRHHPPKDFPIDSIKQIAIVKASIRINSRV